MFGKGRRAVGFLCVFLSLLLVITSSRVWPVSANAMPASAAAVNGILDPGFGTGGKVLTDFGSSDDAIEAVAIQTDGKIVVAGLSAVNGGTYATALARYNSDGSLDLTFGTAGLTAIVNGGSASAMVLQPDGKIVIAGSDAVGFMVARFHSNGSPDASFGTDGVVSTNLGSSNPMDFDYAFSIALQQDGKIVAAGASYTGDNGDFGLVRYNSNGSLDTAFDGDGKIITDFGGSEGGTSIALQADGKVVMAGSSQDGNFVLARYNTNGSLDTTFDGDGKLISNLGTSAGAAQIAIQTNGRFVVAGSTGSPNYNFIVARYNSNGSLDTSFDGDGKAITDFGNAELGRAMTIQPDGRIVVIGSTGIIGDIYTYDLALARYNINGSLDTTFDGDGKVTVSVGCSGDENKAVALQPNGKIVVAGYSTDCVNADFAVTRFNINGSLDGSFHQDGKVTTDFGRGSGYEHAYSVAIQADGKIVAVGNHHNGNYGQNFALARYNPNGSRDLTFGTGGKVTSDFGLRTQGVGYTNSGRAVALQPDGKILVAGSSGNGGGFSRMALARYNPNGSLDPTFSADGKVTTEYGQGWAVALQPDGKVIVAGDTGDPNSTTTDPVSFMLARFNPNGSFDTAFDMDGQVTTLFGLDVHASIRAVAVQPNGKIIVAGFAHRGSYSDFALARYNANGSLDPTFDGDGIAITTFGGSDSYSFGRDLVLQPDGKIVVTGSTRAGPDLGLNSDIALARYNTNGSLDATFDGDGRVISDFGNGQDEDGWSVNLQSDGKVVVAGRNYANFAIARYNTDGSPDTTFYNVGNTILEDFGSDLGGDAALQPDGKIIMAGGSWHDTNYTNYDFALARFSGVAPPGAFTKISPADASSGINLSATLSWGSSPSADLYQYCYDMIDDDQCNRTWTSAASTSAQISNLGTNTTYYWQVRAINAVGSTDADNQTWSSFTTTSTLLAGTASIETFLGAQQQGKYSLEQGLSLRESYIGVNDGPVQIVSNDVPLIGAERVIYKVAGTATSFTELMGLPASQLDNTYWLPWYNNVDLDTQLRFANVSNAPATVHIFIGGSEVTPLIGLSLASGASTRQSFAGINNGPVKIVSNTPIVAAERVIYKVAGKATSFSEMMALPDSQLSATYWLPWYNNADLDTQLRFANINNMPVSVRVFIGGVEMQGSPFPLDANESTRLSFANINGGPVRIESDKPIVAAERVIYKVDGTATSFSEMMGLPAGQLDTTYWLPWYNNVDLDTQLRFANTTNQTATVHIFIGDTEVTPVSGITLLAGESTRQSFVGINNGPVKIVSNVPIVAAERVIYKVQGTATSFSEMMGLPGNELDATYWLPWYNNVDLDTQLRFGVP